MIEDHERCDQLSRKARKIVVENMATRRVKRAFEQICLRTLRD